MIQLRRDNIFFHVDTVSEMTESSEALQVNTHSEEVGATMPAGAAPTLPSTQPSGDTPPPPACMPPISGGATEQIYSNVQENNGQFT